MLRITDVDSAADVAIVRELLREYVEQLGVNLDFQGFEAELAALPGAYTLPRGRLLLARYDGVAVGCVAMRSTADGRAEMKRLYVRDTARGLGVGRALVAQIIDAGREARYEAMVLDTLPMMQSAQRMYEGLGFRDIAPYTANPVVGARFLGLALHGPSHPDYGTRASSFTSVAQRCSGATRSLVAVASLKGRFMQRDTVLRVVRATGIVALLSAIGGAIGGAVLGVGIALHAVITGGFPENVTDFVAGIGVGSGVFGAAYGLVLGPFYSWTLLRHVPIWRAIIEPAAVAALTVGAVFILRVPSTWLVFAAPVLTSGLAAIRLRLASNRALARGGQQLLPPT